MKHLKHLKTLMTVMILSLLTTVAISCAEEKEGSKDSGPVTCRVSVSSGEGGTAETTETEVMQGWEVTLTAKPEETYRFVNWTVNNKEVSRENPYIAIVNTSTQFKANFEKDNYALKVTAGEGGSVKSTSEGELLKGTKVTLTATPNEGYSFVNWTLNGEVVSTKNIYTITITSDVEYIANFISYNVTVESGEGGTAKTDKMQVAPNGKVTLTAISQEGYVFESWTVNEKVVSTANPYMATITADTKFKANFVTLHNVTITASEGGTAKSNKTQVGHNGQVTLTATPNEGYGFVNWTVEGKEVSTENPYTATITAEATFVANFEALPIYAVSVSSNDDAMGTAAISATEAIEGETVTLTATPNEGYSFVNWTVEGKEVSTQNPYTTTITEDIEIKANFKDKYNGHEYVDLGLSVKWATCNVGATAPEGYGNYYAWGETTTKSSYTSGNYTFSFLNPKTLLLSVDAARVNWGGDWRMPTGDEMEELMDTNNCTWEWTTQNGVKGYKVTSKKNGNSIFLPAAGYRNISNLYDAGSGGYYWSSSILTYRPYYVDGFTFSANCPFMDCYDRFNGRSVRPVCE